MPRPPRVQSADALYHVTVRGVQKSPIVRDDHDRIRWCEYLKAAVTRAGLELYAFALMDNHFHLFLGTPGANLGEAMQYLNGSYAAYFNTRHQRKGHVFDNRYHAVLIESQGHYLEVSRYVHLNPVRAGIVKRPEEYAWSSYPSYHFGRMPLPWLNCKRVLAEFTVGQPASAATGGSPVVLRKQARERYRQFVAGGIGKKLPPPWARAVGGWLMGAPKFAAKVYATLAKEKGGDRWDSRAAQGKRGIDASIEDIARAVCERFSLAQEELRAPGRKHELPRVALVLLAREEAGLSLKSIGDYLGIRAVGSITQVVARARQRLPRDEKFRKTIQNIEAALHS